MTDKRDYNKDLIVNNVVNKFITRSKVGIEKYDTSLENNDLSFQQCLIHLQEELMDATNYIEKINSKYEKSFSELTNVTKKIENHPPEDFNHAVKYLSILTKLISKLER